MSLWIMSQVQFLAQAKADPDHQEATRHTPVPMQARTDTLLTSFHSRNSENGRLKQVCRELGARVGFP